MLRRASIAVLALAVAGTARGGEPAARSAGPARLARQALARTKLLAQRALTLPVHLWPFTKVATLLAHGEPLAGLTPGSAVAMAEHIAATNGTGTVVGRLAWELHDPWSVRGAERSYLRLVDGLATAKARNPKLDVAVSIDAESLGVQLDGVSAPERRRVAIEAALRIAGAAKARGLPLELDMGTSDAMPFIVEAARAIVDRLHVPVRLALAARYKSSAEHLRAWAGLARERGLRLGVRLVKGSFIEADQADAINTRRALLDRYKEMITLAMEQGDALDVGVASQNEEIWTHAQRESARLGAEFKMHVIHGVNPPLQAQMRAAGKLAREYVSYGVDAPVMGVAEMYANHREKRALERRGTAGPID